MKLGRWSAACVLFVSLLAIPQAHASSDIARSTALSYVMCSSLEQTTLATAVADATTYATTATTYFSHKRAGSLFTYWFGTYDVARWNTVKQNYTNIRTELVSDSIEFDCSLTNCSAGAYGFVYPNDTRPLTIHLCDVFWTAQSTGTDSRAGSLIHWLSQFTGSGATANLAYGKTSSHALSPAQAVQNSDNYEYFAENTPNIADNAAAFTVNASSHDFGNHTQATTSTSQEFVVTNTGDIALAVTALAVTGDFAIASDTCRSGVVAVNASCTIAVTFSPQAASSTNGTLTIATNAAISTATVALTGTGVAAVTTTAPTTTTSTTIAPTTTAPAPTTTAPAPTTTAPTTTSTTTVPALISTVRPTAVTAKATNGGSRLTVRIGTASQKISRKFVVQVKRGSKWVALSAKYATSRTTATKVIDLPKGQYRVVVPSVSGFTGVTSTVARLVK
jgi:hypothetical protein